MKAPDKIYLTTSAENKKYGNKWGCWTTRECPGEPYIRKDALLEWSEKELERLYELIPDAHKVEDETATPMEMRYLGQYMQMESVINKLNSM